MTPVTQPTDRMQRYALGLAIIGIGAGVVGLLVSRVEFFQAYLLGFTFWIGVSLGWLALLMVTNLAGGAWTEVLQRLLRAGVRTMPLMLLLFLPLLLGLGDLYEWTHAEFATEDAILAAKSVYLNTPFFLIRSVIYFAIWVGFALFLARRNVERSRRWSVLGLVLYVLTVTFASVDWVMSLEPHWYSSIYGLLFVAGQVLSAFALAISIMVFLLPTQLPRSVITDLANILLATLMTWAYLSLMQLIVIWWANIPEEVVWYIRRVTGGWQWLIIPVVLLSFVVPFSLLITSSVKRHLNRLAQVGLLIFVTQFAYTFWLIKPAFNNGLVVHWLDVLLPLGMGSLWLFVFLWQVRRLPAGEAHE